MTEILWSFVNILAVKSDQFALHAIQSGAVTQFSRILDPKLMTPVSKQHTLLSLTALSNMAADQQLGRENILHELCRHFEIENAQTNCLQTEKPDYTEAPKEYGGLGHALMAMLAHISKTEKMINFTMATNNPQSYKRRLGGRPVSSSVNAARALLRKNS